MSYDAYNTLFYKALRLAKENQSIGNDVKFWRYYDLAAYIHERNFNKNVK